MIQVFGSCVGKEELKEIKSSFDNQGCGFDGSKTIDEIQKNTSMKEKE